MNRTIALMSLSLGLSLAACTDDKKSGADAGPSVSLAKKGAKVVVISVDGLRPDAIRLAPAPALMDLISRGAYTLRGQTIRPSITLPSHTSMVTGFSPTEHGILWNDYRPGYVKDTTPTVLALAKQAGLRSILVSGKEKFFTLAPPGGADVFVWASGGDMDVASSALFELAAGYNMALVHFPGTDDMGHSQGWMSASYLAQVRAADAAVAQVVKSLSDDVFVIVTADHGGSGLNHAEDIPDNTTIPWIIVGPGVRKNYELQFDVWTTDTAGTVAKLLGVALPSKAIARSIDEAFTTFTGTVEGCGTVANEGPLVDEQISPDPASMPAGGQLQAGTFELASVTVHAPGFLMEPRMTGRKFKNTILVKADSSGAMVMESAETVSGNLNLGQGMGMRPPGAGGMGMAPPVAMPPVRRGRFRFTVEGAVLKKQRLCSTAVEPGTNPQEEFSASGDDLVSFSTFPVNEQIKLQVSARYVRKP